MMKPALTIGGIPFYDAPSEVEGSPYWVDLWTDVNGYKIGLQVKPVNGEVSKDIENKILAERDLLLQMRPK